MLKYNPKSKQLARQLRKNQTEAEKLIWRKIRKKQIKNSQFYRQRPIGRYIVDFYCPRLKLVIEVDGDSHYLNNKTKQYDLAREQYLQKLGITVFRATNTDVYKNLDGVLQELYLLIEKLEKRGT